MRFMPAECLKDVRRCLRKERVGPTLRKIRDDEASNPSTTLSTNQALFVLYRNFTGLLPEFKEDLIELVKQFQRRRKEESGFVYRR